MLVERVCYEGMSWHMHEQNGAKDGHMLSVEIYARYILYISVFFCNKLVVEFCDILLWS